MITRLPALTSSLSLSLSLSPTISTSSLSLSLSLLLSLSPLFPLPPLQVRPGMDLSKVVLPTFILESRSFLDKLCDYYYHANLLAE